MQSALEALPGVRSVSFTRNALLSGSTSITGIYRQGQTDKEAKDIHYMAVAPKFFDTMQIPIVLGRDFNERDAADPETSAIINETAAKKYLAEREPDRPAPRAEPRRERQDRNHRRHPRHQVQQRARCRAGHDVYADQGGHAIADRDGADAPPIRRA